ncbi:hypothetical protein CEXT_192341 [Caerostris extrusa]|uniref:Uncharacterized protein n=1 Tax=Caerostris extrusa TaxID=172846 RepID=A0AAV4RZC6_CAEEX|nr:hypothetical protein CEXT_192341 [Caerostris extrusa]
MSQNRDISYSQKKTALTPIDSLSCKKKGWGVGVFRAMCSRISVTPPLPEPTNTNSAAILGVRKGGPDFRRSDRKRRDPPARCLLRSALEYPTRARTQGDGFSDPFSMVARVTKGSAAIYRRVSEIYIVCEK